jgi:hypothetical protein
MVHHPQEKTTQMERYINFHSALLASLLVRGLSIVRKSNLIYIRFAFVRSVQFCKGLLSDRPWPIPNVHAPHMFPFICAPATSHAAFSSSESNTCHMPTHTISANEHPGDLDHPDDSFTSEEIQSRRVNTPNSNGHAALSFSETDLVSEPSFPFQYAVAYWILS